MPSEFEELCTPQPDHQLATDRCPVYVEGFGGAELRRFPWLAAKFTPPRWESDTFSQELWM